jgi:hypothetical protein
MYSLYDDGVCPSLTWQDVLDGLETRGYAITRANFDYVQVESLEPEELSRKAQNKALEAIVNPSKVLDSSQKPKNNK